MEQSATPLRAVLAGLAAVVLGLLIFLLAQAARPAIKDPRPLNGATTPKGQVMVSAEVFGEADLREVRLQLDGRPVEPVIVAHSERHWTVSHRAILPVGRHEAALTAIDQRGREQPYRWAFSAAGPSNAPKFADPLPRPDTRLAAGEVLIALAAFSEATALDTLTLTLNGQPLTRVDEQAGKGERTVARRQRALTPGEYTVRAEATDADGETAAYEWRFTIIAPGGGAPGARFFPESGHYVPAQFASYWARHGGLARYGLPITPEFKQGDLTVQWFERARFELHPRLPADQQVQLGLVGIELRQPDPPLPAPPGDRRFFPETGHSIGGRFREYWERNGGMAQFGLPLTEDVVENGRTVQWFERARFEYHAEAAGTPDDVRLSDLGRTLWQRQGAR